MAPKNKPTTADKGTAPPAEKDQPKTPAPAENTDGGADTMETEPDDPLAPGASPMAFAVLLMLLHRELRLDEIMARFCGDPTQINQLAASVQKRFKSAMDRRGTSAADMMTGIDSILESIGKLV